MIDNYYESIDLNVSDDVTIDISCNDDIYQLEVNNNDGIDPFVYNDCTIDDKICFIPIDSNDTSNKISILVHIGGFIDEMIIMDVSPYISLTDVINLSMTCKTFHRLCQSPFIWNILYRHDFISEPRISQRMIASLDFERNTTTIHDVHNDKQQITYTRDMYRQKYVEINERLNRFEEGLEESRMMLHRFRKQHTIEIILEYTQIRVMLPLLFAVTFTTTILLAFKLEGANISYWFCFLFVIVYLAYIMISMIFTMYLHHKQFDLSSIFFGMWINFKSQLSYIYEELLLNDVKQGCCFVASTFLLMLQVILATMRLSAIDNYKHNNDDKLTWVVELIPVWILFLGYLLLPVLFRMNQLWLNGLLIILLPMLLFFICVSFNLNGSQLLTNHRNVSLSIIFIPFWIVEGFLLTSCFVFLRQNVIR